MYNPTTLKLRTQEELRPKHNYQNGPSLRLVKLRARLVKLRAGEALSLVKLRVMQVKLSGRLVKLRALGS